MSHRLILSILLTAAVTCVGASRPALATTNEAIAVWQHRNTGADWDVNYSILGRPNVGDPATALSWRSIPGPAAAAPIAVLPGDDVNAHVHTDTMTGTTIAVWERATGGATGRDIFFARFTGGGSTGWTAAAAVASPLGDDFDPAVALDTDGTGVAVWIHHEATGAKSVQSAFFNGTSWGTPVSVGSSVNPSIPEVTFSSVNSVAGGSTTHRAAAIWSDEIGGNPDPCGGTTHRMFFSVWNGLVWSAPAQISTATCTDGSDPQTIVGSAGSADYMLDTLPAYTRAGIAADSTGKAYATWGGPRKQTCQASPGVVGAILDVAAASWSPMCNPFGGAFIGSGGCESPDMNLTSGAGDVIGVFDFACFIEDTRRVAGTFTIEAFSYNSSACDLRPSNAPIVDRMVAVNWGDSSAVGNPSEIFWSAALLGTPANANDSALTWSAPAAIEPNGLAGEDRYPELASAVTGIQPEICNNGIDDDGDGLIDAQDPDCVEICNGVDDNGNSFIDEGCDNDGDDYCGADKQVVGTPAVCPNGGGDCNDNNTAVNPGAAEVCNGIDDNCNTLIDAADPSFAGCPSDGNPCTDDVCVNGTCGVNNTATCDDGNPCTGPDMCSGGACSGPPLNPLPPECGCCQFTEFCSAPVTQASCEGTFVLSGTCNPQSALCEGGGEPCGNGIVDPGEDCDGPSQCCNPTTCTFEPASTPCDADENLCTTDHCDGEGACVFLSASECPDDGNTCNGPEGCDPDTGECTSGPPLPNGTECDDDDACTTGGSCQEGDCLGGPPPDCGDGDLCTVDDCDPTSGCVNPPVICDDDEACNGFETCNAATGACEAGPPTFLVRDSARILTNAEVQGDLGANGLGGSVRMARHSFVFDDRKVIGDKVVLGRNSSVFDVFANDLKIKTGATIRGTSGPATLPLVTNFDAFCAVPAVACSGSPVVVPGNGSAGPLAPGIYGDMTLGINSTLELAPGAFEFCSVRIGFNAKVLATGVMPSAVNVRDTVRLVGGSFLGPAAGTPPPQLNVAGTLVKIGQNAVLHGSIAAPQALLRTLQASQLQGSFCADRAKIGKDAKLGCGG